MMMKSSQKKKSSTFVNAFPCCQKCKGNCFYLEVTKLSPKECLFAFQQLVTSEFLGTLDRLLRQLCCGKRELLQGFLLTVSEMKYPGSKLYWYIHCSCSAYKCQSQENCEGFEWPHYSTFTGIFKWHWLHRPASFSQENPICYFGRNQYYTGFLQACLVGMV